MASKNGVVGDGARPGEAEWWSDYWLAVTTEEINSAEIRAFWKANESPTLDLLQETAPRIEIGPLYADERDQFDIGPARRVFNLLFLLGTTPEYVLPMISDRLIADIVTAAQPRPDDVVSSASALDQLDAFLREHSGWSLVPFERRQE